ncbi:MAG: NAD(P)-binding protein [Gemmatimonadetes bacterium]|nr:FAD-dependent oxidoreductase [Gemmatimonadota bacterium]NNM04715.1 NAD(P)-binding protein [Gemmatimonadota bacterium]
MTDDTYRVGIIGAGLAGLMAGRTLRDSGIAVTLFDKGRRPGGRANTREHGPHRFDHGAQFFTVRDPALREITESWIAAGIVEEWTGSLVRIQGEEIGPAKPSIRYVGVGGMITLPSYLAQELDVRTDTRVESLDLEDSTWTLFADDGSVLGRFDAVLVAVPAPQAVSLLSPVPELQSEAARVEMAPCWAGMYVFERPLGLGFDGAFLGNNPLSWIARDSSKPGRSDVEAWVLHAGPDWTRANLEMDRVEAAGALLREFRNRFGPLPKVTFQRAHRWSFALVSGPAPGGALFDAARAIGACGDWCNAGRIEGALSSGMAAAERVLNRT